MDFAKLEDLFAEMVTTILKDQVASDNIRISYPTNGQSSWAIDENVVFIRLFEKEDEYAKQLDSTYISYNDTIIKKSTRTRVWEVQLVAYGPQANSNINRIKDGVFRQDVKMQLAGNNVFLIPNMPTCKRIPELFGGQWWERWDLSLNFNELYNLTDEDLGHIEIVEIKTNINQ